MGLAADQQAACGMTSHDMSWPQSSDGNDSPSWDLIILYFCHLLSILISATLGYYLRCCIVDRQADGGPGSALFVYL